MGSRGEIFSARVASGPRTYFFNVKENRTGDLFLNLVESKKSGEADFDRHSIVVFQEDLSRFLDGLNQAVEYLRKPKT
jgi:hypothetical protein